MLFRFEELTKPIIDQLVTKSLHSYVCCSYIKCNSPSLKITLL